MNIVFSEPVRIALLIAGFAWRFHRVHHSDVLFVTPNMHKVHHSRLQPETDSHYSNIFSAWDRVFGTYTSRVDFRTLRYGLDDLDDRATFLRLLRMPF